MGKYNKPCGKIIIVAVTNYFVLDICYINYYRCDRSAKGPRVRVQDYPDLFSSRPITARVREKANKREYLICGRMQNIKRLITKKKHVIITKQFICVISAIYINEKYVEEIQIVTYFSYGNKKVKRILIKHNFVSKRYVSKNCT